MLKLRLKNSSNPALKRDSAKAALLLRPLAPRCRGRCVSSTIAADGHPQAARRAAPHNQRIQQSIHSASKLASGLAADPQRLNINVGLQGVEAIQLQFYELNFAIRTECIFIIKF